MFSVRTGAVCWRRKKKRAYGFPCEKPIEQKEHTSEAEQRPILSPICSLSLWLWYVCLHVYMCVFVFDAATTRIIIIIIMKYSFFFFLFWFWDYLINRYGDRWQEEHFYFPWNMDTKFLACEKDLNIDDAHIYLYICAILDVERISHDDIIISNNFFFVWFLYTKKVH